MSERLCPDAVCLTQEVFRSGDFSGVVRHCYPVAANLLLTLNV